MDIGQPGLEIGGIQDEDAVAESRGALLQGSPRTLRILREELAGQEPARLLFEEEMRRVARIEHPALLRVHATGRTPRPWMLADPTDGISLADHVLRVSPLPEEQALAFVAHAHDAFRYLQGRKQIHVSPTPAHVLRVDGAWKLATFRAVRAWDELRLQKGKKDRWAAFSPPERAGEHPEALRPESFLSWALGVLLRWTVAGVHPDAALPDYVSPALAAIMDRLLDPEPARRPQGRAAVERVLAGSPTDAPAPADARPAIRAPVRKKRRRRP